MKPANRERKLVLIFCGAVHLVIAIASLLAPHNDDSEKSPTTNNSGTAGIKAAYLLLDQLGYATARWEQPPSALASVDAANTILIFAEPDVPASDVAAFRTGIASFLNRGGHILVTGSDASILLPDAATGQPTQPFGQLCVTEPEGRSPLARAGHVSIPDQVRWTAITPAVHVQQWCGADAVVVSYQVGAGSVTWWSSAQPLTNQGLKDDASLKLLLASIDSPGQRNSSQHPPAVLFDEYFHGIKSSLSDYTRGLPLPTSPGNLPSVGLLLVLSFSRRNGPIRLPYAPALAPRPSSSPNPWAISIERQEPRRQPPKPHAAACCVSLSTAADFPAPSPNPTLIPSRRT